MMSDPTTTARPIVAVNPASSRLHGPAGRRRLDRILAEVQRAVGVRNGREPDVLAEGSAEAMAEGVAAAVTDGAHLVVAVGGDGTVRDLAGVLAGTDVPLAIIPVGTANLFAASLRIPMRPDRAAEIIETAQLRRVDLGRVRFGALDGEGGDAASRLFTVGAGIGFDARVMARASEGSKRRLGRYAYFAAAARELAQARAASMRVVADGRELEVAAFEVLVANSGELIPGVLRPARRIRPDDGRLDVFIVEGDGLLDAARGACEAIVRRDTGGSRSGRSRRLEVRSIRVSGPADEPVEVDGDVVGMGWFEAECVPQSLRVLAPGRT